MHFYASYVSYVKVVSNSFAICVIDLIACSPARVSRQELCTVHAGALCSLIVEVPLPFAPC